MKVLSQMPSGTHGPSAVKSCVFAILGTIVEYYDYALYGFFATAIAQAFFSADEPVIGLLKTFGVFVAGSLSKPVGAILFSQIGDREGRSPALKWSIVGIALPTTVIGLTPGFSEIGWLSPCILLLCRIAQGMFVSGESDGVRIFLFETFAARFAYTANGLSGMACMIGIYAASLTASIIAMHPLPEWTFRVPFVISGVLGMVVFWLRISLQETPEFTRFRQKGLIPHAPSLLEVVLKNKKILLYAILICGAAGGAYHFYLVFFGTYLSAILGILDGPHAASYTSQCILIFSVSVLLIGLCADYWGEIVILKIFMLGFLVMLGFNLHSVYQGEMQPWIMWLTAFLITPIHSIGLGLVYKKLSVGERFRCSSIGHAVGSMLFSGSAPWVSLSLWKITGASIAPLLYFLALSLIGYVALMQLVRDNPMPIFSPVRV